MQALAWQLTVFLVGVVAVVFLLVGGYAAEHEAYEPVQKQAYKLRAVVFGALVVAGIPTMAYTLGRLPYVPADAKPAAEVVSVTGYQWYWELDRDQVSAQHPIEFRVTSADVNHGVGIYDPEMQLVAQTQAMPGYVNRLRYTFERTGTYHIACLEYCGLAHHQMMADLLVVPPQDLAQ